VWVVRRLSEKSDGGLVQVNMDGKKERKGKEEGWEEGCTF
jgi:hypothetical protein